MQKNKWIPPLNEAQKLYAEFLSNSRHNNPNKIDTFWEAYNSSRCKTAMLCISIIVTAGFIVTEVTENPSLKLHQVMIILLGYWMGRTSKAKENRLKESGTHE